MNNRLLTPSVDGKTYGMHPAVAMLILAGDLYATPCPLSIVDQHRVRELIGAVLSAARAGGFTQGDILATLLASDEVSARVLSMTVQACEAAGPRLHGVFTELINREHNPSQLTPPREHR